ncbi:MAG: ATP-binding protein [Nanoarchaeota archaeon]|nr:ATP-binding protein [Nanoarchaeota archaeon]
MKETELWYRKLGFAENPFSIKPGIYSDSVYGYPNVIAEVAKGVSAGKIQFVRGNYGNGKSTMLKYLLRKFGGQGRLAYFSCNRMEDRLDVKRILNGRYGFVGKVLDLKPKNMILLLDEAQYLSKEDFNNILRYYDSGNLKSVLFVAKEPINNFMPERMQRAVAVHMLDSVSDSDAVAIVRKRVGTSGIMSDEVIKQVFWNSGYNIRILLKNCEMLCRYAINKGFKSVTPGMVELLPSAREEKAPEERKEMPVPKHFEPLVRAIRQERKDEVEEALDAKPVVPEHKAQPVKGEPAEIPEEKHSVKSEVLKDPLEQGLLEEDEKKGHPAEELYY